MGEDALTAGVWGLQGRQKSDPLIRNSVNVAAARTGGTAFAELLSETIKDAGPSGISGSAAAKFSQGNIVTTGNPLDMAINGNGYFVLRSDTGNIYTRTGAFTVDANYKLVDRATGYRVQRFGSTGDIGPEGEGFQITGDADINVPFEAQIAAKGTSLLSVSGNLSSEEDGQEVRTFSTPIFDSQGQKHILSGEFVRSDMPNTWEMILTSATAGVHNISKSRISGIEFEEGSFKGCADRPEFVMTFDFDGASAQTIAVSMGTLGKLDGLTQFAGSSTAEVARQDGCPAGELVSVSVDNGMVVGAFSNGQKQDLASIQIALFENPAALENAGNGCYTVSNDSGQAVMSQASSGGAGEVHGGALEKSTADVAADFVTIIKAQNGFQTNARTIKIANDILGEMARYVR